VKVIDLDSGETVQAANDEDLAKVVVERLRKQGQSLTEEEARELVANRAYEATDS
jgi:hypothetical protein